MKLLISILAAQLACHLVACDVPPTTPDAPLPTCASLGCTFTICSSHDGPCLCHEQACTPGAP